MTLEEKRYRVTTEYKSIYQIVVEATSPEEAEYFAKDIDLDKWSESGSDWEVLDVSKNYFLRRIKVEQPESGITSPTPRIVTDSE